MTLASGVVPAPVRNTHGVALLAGVALAALLGEVARDPVLSRSAEAHETRLGHEAARPSLTSDRGAGRSDWPLRAWLPR